MKINVFLEKIVVWGKENSDILGLCYVGSWARNTARADSDLDLVIITSNPKKYLSDRNWISKFGSIRNIKEEDWGLVKTLRVFYKNNLEVEFNIAAVKWASIDPIDPGTKKVILDGMKILYDPAKILLNLNGSFVL